MSAEQMAAAARAARDNAANSYTLTEFNCTDYIKRIANAAVLWLPVSSEALYLSNSGLWISSPGKLGLALRQAASSSDAINTSPGKSPNNRGTCR